MGIWGIRMRKEVWDRVGAHLLSEPGVLLHLLAHPRLLTVRLCVHHLQRVEGAGRKRLAIRVGLYLRQRVSRALVHPRARAVCRASGKGTP